MRAAGNDIKNKDRRLICPTSGSGRAYRGGGGAPIAGPIDAALIGVGSGRRAGDGLGHPGANRCGSILTRPATASPCVNANSMRSFSRPGRRVGETRGGGQPRRARTPAAIALAAPSPGACSSLVRISIGSWRPKPRTSPPAGCARRYEHGLTWKRRRDLLDATIQHLRADCRPFNGNVAGAADFRLGLQTYNATLPLPAAYVVPLDQDSDGNRAMTGLVQVVTQGWSASRSSLMPGPIAAVKTRHALRLHRGRPLGRGAELDARRLQDAERPRLLVPWRPVPRPRPRPPGPPVGIRPELAAHRWRRLATRPVPLESIEVDGWKVPPQDMDDDHPGVVVMIDTRRETQSRGGGEALNGRRET